MTDELEPRGTVRLFALAIEERLRANNGKAGWYDVTPLWLVAKLLEEAGEVAALLVRDRPVTEAEYDAVCREAADVGAIAMMIADRTGDLRGRRYLQNMTDSKPTAAKTRDG